MSTSDTETEFTSADACHTALRAALEKGLTFCDTEQSRLEVLGKLVGFDTDMVADIDRDDVLDAGPGDSIAEQRTWVLCQADKLIEGGDITPLDAINQAWADVGDVVSEEEPEEEPAEPEADLEPEEEEEDDDLEALADEIDPDVDEE